MPRSASRVLDLVLISLFLAPPISVLAGGAPPSAMPRFDLAAVVRQVHFAFRREGDHFKGGHSSYDVEAQPDGRWTFRPARAHAKGAAISFASTIAGAGVPALAVDGDGSLRISRGAVVEHLRNTDQGVEQSWVFTEAPKSRGDVIVRVAVSGQSFAGETSEGLHFVDRDNGIGVRYGAATWIDNRGVRTQVRPRFRNGQIEIVVPAATVAQSSFPATLDPVISSEFGTDNIVLTPWNGSTASSTPIAFDGTNYVVVWNDSFRVDAYSVLGARVSPTGALVDPSGFVVASYLVADGYFLGIEVGIACGPASCLAIWSASTPAIGNDGVWGRLIDDGAVVGPEMLLASTPSHSLFSPSVAFNGARYLVVYQDATNLGGVTVEAAGIVGLPHTLAAGVLSSSFNLPNEVASDGTGFLAVWETADFPPRIRGQRLDGAGLAVGPVLMVASGPSEANRMPAVAFDGSTYVVVNAVSFPPSCHIFGRTVDHLTGVVGAPFQISFGASGRDVSPSVAANGSNLLVAWTDLGDSINAQRVHNGALVGLPIPVGPTPLPWRSVTAGDGANFAVAYQDGTPGDSQVLVRTIFFDGSLVALTAVSQTGNEQIDPSIAYDGTNFLVVWADSRNTGSRNDIFGARVTPAGGVLDPSGISIGTGAGNDEAPAVAFNSGNYLVVWRRNQTVLPGADVLRAVVQANGIVPSPVAVIASEQNRVNGLHVVGGTSGFFAVWGVGNPDVPDVAIRGARLDPVFGLPIGAILDIHSAVGGTNPDVDFDGVSSYLVVWQDRACQYCLTPYSIRARRIAQDGSMLGPDFSVSSSVGSQTDPAVAFGGGNHIVTWSNKNVADQAIVAARVTSAGIVLDPASVVIRPFSATAKRFPRIAFDGANAIVGWIESPPGDLLVSRVVPNLTSVLDSPPMLFATGVPSRPPALATDAHGITLVGHSRFDQTAAAGRIFLRLLSDPHDTTPPVVTCDPADVAWHDADVSIACTAVDGDSGLENPGDAAFSLTTSVPDGTETAAADTGTHSVCDAAGNCATAGPVGANMVDKKDPSVTVTTPAEGASYVLNQAVTPVFNCTDDGSGIASCVPSSSPLPTAAVGSFTFTVNATDIVGHSASADAHYTVVAATCALYDTTQAKKAGSTVPIRVQLCDATGHGAPSAAVLTAVSVGLASGGPTVTPEDAGNSNPGHVFRYDPTTGAYSFNLKTTGFGPGLYNLTFTVSGDPASHVTQFRLK